MVTIQNVISVIEGGEEPERYDQNPQSPYPQYLLPNSNLGKGRCIIYSTNPSVGSSIQLECDGWKFNLR